MPPIEPAIRGLRLRGKIKTGARAPNQIEKEAVKMIISFYGLDGCGKGTQIEALILHIRETMGYRVFYSKAYAEAEKEQLGGFMDLWGSWAKTFAFQAMHAHQAEQAFKAERRGQIVIADRWDESYLAYHKGPSSPLQADPELYLKLNKIAFQGREPDIGILLDLDPETAKRRLVARGYQDFFDQQPNAYHEYMRKGFLEIAEERGHHIISSSDVWGVVADKVRRLVEPAILADATLKPLPQTQTIDEK